MKSPARTRDEFFARQDAELIKQLRAKQAAEAVAAERKSHHMKCPKCGATLEERDQNGLKVDVCPECHGMWLDQGEIAIMSKVAAQNPGSKIVHDLMHLFHRSPRK